MLSLVGDSARPRLHHIAAALAANGWDVQGASPSRDGRTWEKWRATAQGKIAIVARRKRAIPRSRATLGEPTRPRGNRIELPAATSTDRRFLVRAARRVRLLACPQRLVVPASGRGCDAFYYDEGRRCCRLCRPPGPVPRVHPEKEHLEVLEVCARNRSRGPRSGPPHHRFMARCGLGCVARSGALGQARRASGLRSRRPRIRRRKGYSSSWT